MDAKELGTNISSSIISAADHETRGELYFLFTEEIWALDDDADKNVRKLDKDAVIEAAVAEFRTRFAEGLEDAIERVAEEEDED